MFVSLASTTAFAAKQVVDIRADFNDEFGISAVANYEGPQELVFKRTPDIPLSYAYTDARAMRAIGGVVSRCRQSV